MEVSNELNEEIITMLEDKLTPYLERLKLLENKQTLKDKEIVILKHAVNDVFIQIENNKSKLKKLPKCYLKSSLY